MAQVTVTVEKEFSRQRDADNAVMLVKVQTRGTYISGYATNILSASSYHLDDELYNDLEAAGIDADEIRDALEDGTSTLTMDLDVRKTVEDLTDEEAKALVLGTDETYDQFIGTHGDYEAWHNFARVTAKHSYGVEAYSCTEMDALSEKVRDSLGYGDHDCDADLDAWARRHDCEV